MNLFASSPPPARLTLRVLAHLLRYPDAAFRANTAELRQALRDEAALPATRLAELDALIRRLATQPALDIESEYVELFDRGRRTALHLFEHVHGDSRDRGPALIDLMQTYEKAGLQFNADELPDHLPVVLEFASTQPPEVAKEFLGEMAHILNAIHNALQKRNSLYAGVLGALIEMAGDTTRATEVPDEAPLDESWEEPLAFDGCSTQGQATPGQAQPIRIVRTKPHAQGAST